MSVASAPSTFLSESTTQDPKRREEALQAFAGRPVEERLKQLVGSAIDEGRSVYGRTVRSAGELFDAMQSHARRRGQGGSDARIMLLDTFRLGLRRLGVGLTRRQELGAFARLARPDAGDSIPRDAFTEYFQAPATHSPAQSGTRDRKARARHHSGAEAARSRVHESPAFQRLVHSVHTLVSSHRLVMGRRVDDLRDLFAAMESERQDTPHLLTRDEFVRGLLRTGLGVSRAQAKEVFHACDTGARRGQVPVSATPITIAPSTPTDGDGVVSYKEFLANFKFEGAQEERADDTAVTAAMEEVRSEAGRQNPPRRRRRRPSRIQGARAEQAAVQLLRAAVRSRRESFSAVISELEARFQHWEEEYIPPRPEDAGTVSRTGFVSTFTAMGVRVTRGQAEDLFASLDPEDTGRIDYRIVRRRPRPLAWALYPTHALPLPALLAVPVPFCGGEDGGGPCPQRGRGSAIVPVAAGHRARAAGRRPAGTRGVGARRRKRGWRQDGVDRVRRRPAGVQSRAPLPGLRLAARRQAGRRGRPRHGRAREAGPSAPGRARAAAGAEPTSLCTPGPGAPVPWAGAVAEVDVGGGAGRCGPAAKVAGPKRVHSPGEVPDCPWERDARPGRLGGPDCGRGPGTARRSALPRPERRAGGVLSRVGGARGRGGARGSGGCAAAGEAVAAGAHARPQRRRSLGRGRRC